MENFNKLSPAESERLACLAEECGEVIQAITKILRHGYEDYSPFDETKTTNRKNLERELGDLHYWMIAMCLKGDASKTEIHTWAEIKASRIGNWLHHNHAIPKNELSSQSSQTMPSQSVIDERETGANATMAFGDWWMGEGARGIEPANMSLVYKAFRAGWQARAQLNTKPTNNDALDAERWRYFYNNAQTALMLGSNLDPNNDSIDWLEECNRLADSAMKEVK